jgi:hypothetical protein
MTYNPGKIPWSPRYKAPEPTFPDGWNTVHGVDMKDPCAACSQLATAQQQLARQAALLDEARRENEALQQRVTELEGELEEQCDSCEWKEVER